jgi:hypothetical protein
MEWSPDDKWLQAAVANHLGYLYTIGVAQPGVTLVRDMLHEDVGFVAASINRSLGLVAFPNYPIGRHGDIDEVRVCDLETLDVVDTLDLGAHWATTLRWSPDGRRLGVLYRQDNELDALIYDARTRERRSSTMPFVDDPESLAWNSGSTELAAGMSKGTIQILDAASLDMRVSLAGHRAPVRGLAWSPDGTRIASCAHDGTLRIWDRVSGDQLAVFRMALREVDSVDWSRDGRKLAVGLQTGDVLILDAGISMSVVDGPATAPYKDARPLQAIAAIQQRAAASKEILLDDFNDQDDDGWTRHDASAGKPGGPGSHDASSGAYHLTTSEDVPPGLPAISYLAATWDKSSHPMYSNGFIRAKVRIDTEGCIASIGFRISNIVNHGSGYLFSGGPGVFQIQKVEAGRPTKTVHLGSKLKLGPGEEWWIEAGGVGDQLSMKVWRVGKPEPKLPQLTVVDSTFTGGLLALETNISWPDFPEPSQVNATFDDVYFTPIGNGSETHLNNKNQENIAEALGTTHPSTPKLTKTSRKTASERSRQTQTHRPKRISRTHGLRARKPFNHSAGRRQGKLHVSLRHDVRTSVPASRDGPDDSHVALECFQCVGSIDKD